MFGKNQKPKNIDWNADDVEGAAEEGFLAPDTQKDKAIRPMPAKIPPETDKRPAIKPQEPKK